MTFEVGRRLISILGPTGEAVTPPPRLSQPTAVLMFTVVRLGGVAAGALVLAWGLVAPIARPETVHEIGHAVRVQRLIDHMRLMEGKS